MILLVFVLPACDDPPPPPPPPPSDAGPGDSGVDGGPPDSGFDAAMDDAGADADTDAGTDAGPFDAGPPPATGPFADLYLGGRHTDAYRLVPPANYVQCNTSGSDDGYIGLSVNPSGVDADALEIDIFGPVTVRSYTPRSGRARPGQFGMLYRVSGTETYLLDTTSTPCDFEVTSLAGGVLEATFDCRGLVNFAAPAAESLDVRGRVRCDYP